MSSGPYRAIQDDIRHELHREVGGSRFRLWFRDTEVRDVDGDDVTLAVPTEVHRTWLECIYGSTLRRAVEQVLGEGVRIRLEVGHAQGLKREIRECLPSDPLEWNEVLEKRRPRPTFESFVCDGPERFPVLLLSQLVHGNGAVNPPSVFLYGDQGTGKTHLLRALCETVEGREPGHALYLTSRRFTQMYVAALRARDLRAVRAFEVDFEHRRLVVIDDLDRLGGRTATQQALVRLRERAVGTSTRFVFAASAHPQDIDGLSPTLRSWLMGSAILRLGRPGAEGLREIMATRALAFGMPSVPEPVATWIEERTGSVRAAIEVIDRWAAASSLAGQPLGVEWLAEISPSVSVTTREEIVRRVKQVVAGHYDIPAPMLGVPTKVRRAARPRRIAMYLVYRATALPLAEIGVAFGLKSHSSVSRAIVQIREERLRDPALEQELDGLLARI